MLRLSLALLPPRLRGAAPRKRRRQRASPDFLASEPGFAELGALGEPLGVREPRAGRPPRLGLSPERIGRLRGEARRDPRGPRAEAGLAPTASRDRAKAEAILTFLHKRVLKAYREDATTLDGILDSGLYNCVSLGSPLHARRARAWASRSRA